MVRPEANHQAKAFQMSWPKSYEKIEQVSVSHIKFHIVYYTEIQDQFTVYLENLFLNLVKNSNFLLVAISSTYIDQVEVKGTRYYKIESNKNILNILRTGPVIEKLNFTC